MTAARAARGRGSAAWPAIALALAALGALGLLIADEALGARADSPDEVVEVDAVDRGVRYCPVTAGEEESATLVLAAGPEATEATVVRYGQAGPERGEPHDLAAGEQRDVTLDGGEAGDPVAVEWRGGPVAASWHVEGERDAGAPCPTVPAPTWHLAGMDTALGAETTLHLFNPFSVDAVVRVRFGTPEGRVDLLRTDNVVVPAGGTEVVDLVDVQPEEPELGVTVETLAGRVIAGGELDRTRLDEDDDEGPQGRTLVPAVAEPGQRWHLPSAIVGEAWESDVVVYNPGEREAAVTVSTSDPLGDVARAEHAVPPGGTTRLPLTDLAEPDAFAVVVETVTEVPVVVVRHEGFLDADQPGYTVQPGLPAASTWVVPRGPGDRAELVAMHNAGGDPVDVDVTIGGESVEGWTGETLAPNDRATLDLGELEPAGGPVLITADGEISATLISNLADGNDFGRILGLAVPITADADVPHEPMPVRHDPPLATEPIRPPGRDPDEGPTEPDEELDLPDLDEDGDASGEDG